jgi:UDPglucose 6-dehydrogenase
MKVTIIGAGYVGLVTGACLAEVGNDVMCLDLDAGKIAMLQAGGMPIFEPGLQALVQGNVDAGRLQFTTSVEAAVAFGRIQMIAVATPPDDTGAADTQHVLAAACAIGRLMQEPKLVVTKSTVPVGTAAQVGATIAHELALRGLSLDCQVASNPEFLKEGAAVADFMRPDRIVVGTDCPAAAEMLQELYAPFQRNHERLVLLDIASAELSKYAANAMLATRISVMNELAGLAEKVGADIEQVRRAIGADSRIGRHFLYAGTGYGGSCLPKDLLALQHTAQQAGVALPVLRAVQAVNSAQKLVLVDKLIARFGPSLRGMRFALWGLAFKPQTDDMRDAPSRAIMERLWALGATVQAYDPAAMPEARRIYGERPDLQLASSPMEALRGADALLIVTEWKPFKSPDFALMKALLRQPVVMDGRNLYEPARVRAAGLEYFAVGRG